MTASPGVGLGFGVGRGAVRRGAGGGLGTRLARPAREALSGVVTVGAEVAGRSASAAPMVRTSQALTDRPAASASSSMRGLSRSGRRRLRRAVPPSSPSSAAGAGAGVVDGGTAPARRDDEVGIAAAQPDLDRPGRQGRGDLGGGLDEGVEDDEAGRGLEGAREELGQLDGLVATRAGGGEEVALEASGVGQEVHDATMTSL